MRIGTNGDSDATGREPEPSGEAARDDVSPSEPWSHRIARVTPLVGVLGSYRRGWVVRDVLAAVTICAVLVPQALAYGQLAGLSPVTGLYAALAPLVLYPLFASSRRLMVGPESGLAILTALVAGAAGG